MNRWIPKDGEKIFYVYSFGVYECEAPDSKSFLTHKEWHKNRLNISNIWKNREDAEKALEKAKEAWEELQIHLGY